MAAYPTTPRDFAHPGTPHDPRLSPASGANDRPLLVIVSLFSDQAVIDESDRADVDAQFFGDDHSVVDFFRTSSFGRLDFSRAVESQGVANDGIAFVPVTQTYAQWAPMLESTRHKLLLQQADSVIDFAAFDRDGEAG